MPRFRVQPIVWTVFLLAGIACRGGKPRLLFDPSGQEAQFNANTDASADTTISNIVGIDAGCVSASLRGQLRPSNLLFVVDRSGSMNCNLPEDGQSSPDCDQFPIRRFPERPSKWELTLNALRSALTALSVTGRVQVAISVFPEQGSACTVTSAPVLPFASLDSKSVENVMQRLASMQPYGNTPLVGATILGYQYLLDEMRQNSLDSDTFVVLVTDGRETCRADQVEKLLGVDAPNALQKLGVRTFVIGAPGSEEARSFLSSLAEAGGTVRSQDCVYTQHPSEGNCHFDMTTSKNFSGDLVDALSHINAEILSCSFSIPQATGGVPVDLKQVNVSLSGHSIPFNANPSCSEQNDGWHYTPGNASIRLCGAACTTAQQPGTEVSIILGCTTNVW